MGRHRFNPVQKAIYDAMLRYARSGTFGPAEFSMSVTNAVLNGQGDLMVAFDEKVALALGWKEVRRYADPYVRSLYAAGVRNRSLLLPEEVERS